MGWYGVVCLVEFRVVEEEGWAVEQYPDLGLCVVRRVEWATDVGEGWWLRWGLELAYGFACGAVEDVG